MALPKGKISKSRGRMRRANWKLSAPGIVKCPRCQQMKLAHLGVRQVLSVLQGAQHGFGGFHHGGDMGLGLSVQRLTAQQFGHGQDAVQRRAQLVTQQVEEAVA